MSGRYRLLRYPWDVGFRYAPRLLGVDAKGRQILTYIEGESGAAGSAKVVAESGLVAMARLLRDYHDAVRG